MFEKRKAVLERKEIRGRGAVKEKKKEERSERYLVRDKG